MKNKRKILVAALIVCVVAILSVGSLAWFTAEDTVTNTVRFADDFEIDLFEKDETGAAIVDDSGNTIGRTYPGVLPGQLLHKEPVVWNKGTEPQWVRVTVELGGSKELWTGAVKSPGEVFKNFNAAEWTLETPDYTKEPIRLVCYLNHQLASNQQSTLFDSVVIPTAFTQEDVEVLDGALTITVKAEAIQAKNLPDDVKTAQAAFALIDN